MRRGNFRFSCIAALGAICALYSSARGGAVLDSVARDPNGEGYGGDAWPHMTAAMNLASANGVTTVSDLSNLSQMLQFNGIWVDMRQFDVGSLSSTETANLTTYAASGRRVVLIGANSGYLNWDNSILNWVGGSFSGNFANQMTQPLVIQPVTAGVSAIAVPSAGLAGNGYTLFKDRIATVWGPARNVIVCLSPVPFDDDRWTQSSNAAFGTNLANWIAGGVSDDPCLWQNSTGGSWTGGANWSESYMPAVADDAVFNLSSIGGYTVNLAAAVTTNNLLVKNDRVTLDLVSATASLVIASNIHLGVDAGTNGQLILNHSTGGGNPSISAGGLSIGDVGFGSLVINSGASLTISGDAAVNQGAVTVNSGGTLNILGHLSGSAGGAMIAVNGGNLIVNAAITGGASVSLVNGRIQTPTISAGQLSLSGGQFKITPAAVHGELSTVAQLTISGTAGNWAGQLDLSNTDLLIEGGSIAAVSNQLASGYRAGGGLWTGQGIVGSSAAADPSGLTTLGVLLNDDGTGHALYGSGAALGLFDGVPPPLDSILIKYTYTGDSNLDGRVDGSDYTRIDNGFNNHLTGWSNGDFNYDNLINGSDYTLIDNAFNTQGGALEAGFTPPPAGVVPEPSTTGLIGLMIFAALDRWRFKHNTVQ